MNCSEVQQFLSEYYDGELAEKLRRRVAEHLDHCPACARELGGFENMSQMASALDTPVPPEQLWNRIEAQLGRPSPVQPQPVSKSSRPPPARWFALAASILFAMGLSWFTYQALTSHGEHSRFAAEIRQYLDEFHRDPDAAQQFLLAKYENESVQVDQAAKRVSYRPAVADGLPEGYKMEATNVMKMPCCTCVQCLCKRSDDSTVAIFEHDEGQTREWFGDRPEVSVNCHGTRCTLVETKNQITVTWTRGKRHLTIIGLRDVGEVTEFVAWFDPGP